MKFRLILGALTCGFLWSTFAHSAGQKPEVTLSVKENNDNFAVTGRTEAHGFRFSFFIEGDYKFEYRESEVWLGKPEQTLSLELKEKMERPVKRMARDKADEIRARRGEEIEKENRQLRNRKIAMGATIASATLAVLAAGVGGLYYYFQKSEPQAEESASEALPESN